jgi:anti-sigma regulatory factor (Ser/Thr protein kinase)
MEWTKLEDVTWWVEQIARGRNGEVFDGPGFLRPYHFTMLGCEAHRRGINRMIIPDHLIGYAARMQLWQSIGLDTPDIAQARNPGGKFHPLTPIVSECSAQDLADAINEVFVASGTLDPATLNAINTALSEIFSNCFFHANTNHEICGLACAQVWPAARRAQVAVADIGIGVRASLAGNPTYLDRLEHENANELATELGVTSKPYPVGPHSGYGLAIARQLMERHSGNFLLFSSDEAFRATPHGSEGRKLLTPWDGAIVILEWDTALPLDIGAVYATWPSDGDSDALI